MIMVECILSIMLVITVRFFFLLCPPSHVFVNSVYGQRLSSQRPPHSGTRSVDVLSSLIPSAFVDIYIYTYILIYVVGFADIIMMPHLIQLHMNPKAMAVAASQLGHSALEC